MLQLQNVDSEQTGQCMAVHRVHRSVPSVSIVVQMAPMLSGRIDIQYRRVQCTPPSNLQVNIDQNSGTGGFLKMSVSVSPHQLPICLIAAE